MSDPISVYEKELTTGLNPTAGKRQGPFWRDGRNVTFEDFAVKSSLGQFVFFDAESGEQIMGARTTVQGGKKTVYYGTLTALKKWTLEDGVTDLTNAGGPYSGTENDLWSWARWGEWMVASNGVDPIQVDKNTTAFVDLAGTPFDWAKVIYGTDTQLFAFNTSVDPGDIEFCDIDDIETWTPAVSNQAGAKIQRNLASGITCAVPLGQGIAAYTEYEVIGINYIGTPYIYSILPLERAVGAVGKNAVAVVGDQNWGFSKSGIWITDGSVVNWIDSPAIHEFIFGLGDNRVNKDQAHLVCAWHDVHSKAVTFFYPTKDSDVNDIGVSVFYNVNGEKTAAWTVYDYGRNCVDDRGIFDFAVSGDKNGRIFSQNVDGTPYQTGNQGQVELDPTYSIHWDEYGVGGYGGTTYGGGSLDGAG